MTVKGKKYTCRNLSVLRSLGIREDLFLMSILMILWIKCSIPQFRFITYANINQAIALKGDKALSIKTVYSPEYYKLLDGRNINRYSIKWSGNYLDYHLERIHSCKRKDIFECNEKILFRRVSAKLIATYDDEQYYALNTLVVVTPKHECRLKYILGLLNSNLFNYIYSKKFKP